MGVETNNARKWEKQRIFFGKRETKDWMTTKQVVSGQDQITRPRQQYRRPVKSPSRKAHLSLYLFNYYYFFLKFWYVTCFCWLTLTRAIMPEKLTVDATPLIETIKLRFSVGTSKSKYNTQFFSLSQHKNCIHCSFSLLKLLAARIQWARSRHSKKNSHSVCWFSSNQFSNCSHLIVKYVIMIIIII